MAAYGVARGAPPCSVMPIDPVSLYDLTDLEQLQTAIAVRCSLLRMMGHCYFSLTTARACRGQKYDDMRETVIKRCRDMQKHAKTAIYCLHRGDEAGATRDLGAVEAGAAELAPLLQARSYS